MQVTVFTTKMLTRNIGHIFSHTIKATTFISCCSREEIELSIRDSFIPLGQSKFKALTTTRDMLELLLFPQEKKFPGFEVHGPNYNAACGRSINGNITVSNFILDDLNCVDVCSSLSMSFLSLIRWGLLICVS